jgi:hypothetical protein
MQEKRRMNRLWRCATPLVALFAAGLVAAEDPPLTIKEVMGQLNRPPRGLTGLLRKELQADQPDWDQIQGQTRKYATLVAGLGKAEPPKGDADSWTRLTKEFLENARAMEDAAKKQDKRGVLAAHAKISRSCTGCHRMHKG